VAEIVNEKPVEGYFAPVHRSLTEPILLAGAPRAFAILNGTCQRLWVSASSCGSPGW
jgi:type IV secretory pathway TrbD component